MTGTRLILLIGAMLFALAPGHPVHAQQGQLPHVKAGVMYSGFGRWIVYLNSTDLNFRRQPVADFKSEAEARKVAKGLNEALPLSSPYFYEVSERSGDSPAPDLPAPIQPGGKPIEIPKPKTADPKPSKPVEPNNDPFKNTSPAGRYKDENGRIYLFTRDGKVYSGGKLIGQWREVGEDLHVNFTDLKPRGVLTPIR